MSALIAGADPIHAPAKLAPAAPRFGLRPAIKGLRSWKIREIAHAGIGRADHIPLWLGEPAGNAFYQPNPGIHELRLTSAEYINGLYGPGSARRTRP